MTQRERIEAEKRMYTKKSGVEEVNIIVPDKVVEVVFGPGVFGFSFLPGYDYKNRIKTVCDDEDTFSLERALYIAIAKSVYGHIYTSEGIEKMADEFSYSKQRIREVKNAMKVYECQQKLAALDREEKAIKERQHKKRMEQKARRLARKAEERMNEQIEIQKEAFVQALREVNKDK